MTRRGHTIVWAAHPRDRHPPIPRASTIQIIGQAGGFICSPGTQRKPAPKTSSSAKPTFPAPAREGGLNMLGALDRATDADRNFAQLQINILRAPMWF